MKKLFALTVVAALTFATATPPVVSATAVETLTLNVPVVEECKEGTAAMTETCAGTLIKITIYPNGDYDVQVCSLEGVNIDIVFGDDGSISVETTCDYGRCGEYDPI